MVTVHFSLDLVFLWGGKYKKKCLVGEKKKTVQDAINVFLEFFFFFTSGCLHLVWSSIFLQLDREVWSLDLEREWGRTKQWSILDRHFWNSSFMRSKSSSDKLSWDEQRILRGIQEEI